MEGYKVLPISYNETKPFILHIHYAKRMPSITYSFGLFYQNELVGIVTYGSPPSQALCRGIAGDEYKNIILELNRLVLKNNIIIMVIFIKQQIFYILVYRIKERNGGKKILINTLVILLQQKEKKIQMTFI